MVRTPLARSVSGSEFLGSVCLYLPYYDEDALDAVIAYLSEPDPGIGFPTRVQRGEQLVTLTRNAAVAEALDAAEQLVTYKVEQVAKQSNVRRLLRLGRLLAWDKLDTAASGAFTTALVDELAAERDKVVGSEEFAKRLADAASIDVRAVTVAYGGTEKTHVTSTQLVAVAGNVEHAFAEAGRRLGGGLHASYLNLRAAEDDAPPVPAVKLELYALLQDPAVLKRVEESAGELLARRLEQHKVAVRALPDERRQHYRHIRRQAAKPEPEPWELPDSIEGSKDGNTKFDRHLYVTDAGAHACTLNGWERAALEEALGDPDAVAWVRNEPRKPWSFTIPYQVGGDFKPLYPDLLVFRRQDDGLVCDILEPHSPDFADTVAKAKGLAAFARDHGDEFGRIRLIAKLGKGYKAIALDDVDMRDKVLGVATKEHLDQLFAAA
jgi:type III restriction enzyme